MSCPLIRKICEAVAVFQTRPNPDMYIPKEILDQIYNRQMAFCEKGTCKDLHTNMCGKNYVVWCAKNAPKDAPYNLVLHDTHTIIKDGTLELIKKYGSNSCAAIIKECVLAGDVSQPVKHDVYTRNI